MEYISEEDFKKRVELKGSKKIIVLSGTNNIEFVKKIILENEMTNCSAIQSFEKDECKIITMDNDIQKLGCFDNFEKVQENNIKKFINKNRRNKWN